MRHGSLFSGIGGFDYAAQQMGWENVFHCEWNEFGQKVLKYYWPKAITYNDITKTDFTIHRGTIDVLTGGFPCQPYSQAGKRLGKEDDRHLWPEMLRAIREIEPTWVVGENVLGLVNWNGGLVFDEVQTDLEAQGYEVQPFVLPAAAVNAPHRRDRIWFVAYSGCERTRSKSQSKRTSNNAPRCGGNENTGVENDRNQGRTTPDTESEPSKWMRPEKRETGEPEQRKLRGSHSEYVTTDSHGIRLRGEGDRIRKSRFISETNSPNNWQNFPTVSPICNGDDGLSERLDSITFSKWRNESIKAGGNAIVPQAALQIFKAIELYNSTLSL